MNEIKHQWTIQSTLFVEICIAIMAIYTYEWIRSFPLDQRNYFFPMAHLIATIFAITILMTTPLLLRLSIKYETYILNFFGISCKRDGFTYEAIKTFLSDQTLASAFITIAGLTMSRQFHSITNIPIMLISLFMTIIASLIFVISILRIVVSVKKPNTLPLIVTIIITFTITASFFYLGLNNA